MKRERKVQIERRGKGEDRYSGKGKGRVAIVKKERKVQIERRGKDEDS